MKKILRISASLLLMGLIACVSALTCFAGAVNTLNTTEKDDSVLFYGTVDGETLAVSLMVYDQSGDNLVSIASAAVDDKNEYSIEMQLSKGTYVVKIADYNGGSFLEKTVTIVGQSIKPEDNDKDKEKEDTSKPTETTDNNKTESTEEMPKSPQTGDNSNISIWISLLFVSIIVLSATAVLRKKN
ncbi:MAG: hypothetical protein UHO61_09095 [Acutalibacteraceae bacterium]|nr:hypothetical protein [Acutalibacteraceae bacterium]